MDFKVIEEQILPFVEKPARYIGGEVNSVQKRHNGRCRVVLIYPDAYEIGISNLGLKILYHILNRRDEFVCERAYTPWIDMEQSLREYRQPLYSLESKTPLKDFDILGFSFQYELLYSNFLTVLDLSGIAFYSHEREEDDPLIIAGGPASLNLEPVARFLDAVCVGDGESRIVEMAESIRLSRAKNLSRHEILDKLAELDGVYVPSLYEEEKRDGFIIPVGKTVKRFSEPTIDDIDFNTAQLIPNIQAVQDRAVIEVARGCVRGCRFCQAGIGYRPVRERSVNHILSLARRAIQSTGYREFSLISLSISDYSRLTELVNVLDKQFSPHGVSFSLPSLRLDTFTLDLAKKVREIRKSGLTFAVEGGSQHIRDAINKGVDEEELFKVLDIADSLGWKSVKLYFMIGLPGYTSKYNEVDEIIALVGRIRRAHPSLGITVSAATFVPKPHTPYQWEAQMPLESSHEELHRLISTFRRDHKVSIRINNPEVSIVEGIFSRGDRALSDVIIAAWKKGARFDGWNEFFNADLWFETMRERGLDPECYTGARTKNARLPWDVIDSGVSKAYLLSELDKSESEELTPDCRDKCTGCTLCDFKEIKHRPAPKENAAEPDPNFLNNIRLLDKEATASIRFAFTKRGEQKYITQIDLEHLFSRALIRANIPVQFTRGFNPHIRVEMGWAIPVGFESLFEVSQLDLHSEMNIHDFTAALSRELPKGIRIKDARALSVGHKLNKHAKTQVVHFEMAAPFSEEEIRKRYEQNKLYLKKTPKKEKEIRIDDYLKSFKVRNGILKVAYLQNDGGARIQDIIDVLCGLDNRNVLKYHPLITARNSTDDKISILEV